MADRYTFVTVVFEAEYDLLVLQARSMRIYCSPEIVSSVVIVDNSIASLPGSRRDQILAEYGRLSGMVRFVRWSDLTRLRPPGGWWSQQILKLLVSEIVQTERYLVLDAKNHLVSVLRREFLEAPDGRARVNSYSYEDHRLRPQLEHVLTYVGLDVAPYLTRFTQTITPFVMHTNIVRRLMSDLSKKEGTPFETVFRENRLTEFFLYTAYRIKAGEDIREIYEFDQPFCPTVWQHNATREGCIRAVAEATEKQSPFFALHRRAIMRLSRECRYIIADFWQRRGLFSSKERGNSFILHARWEYRLHSVRLFVSRAFSRARRVAKRGTFPSIG